MDTQQSQIRALNDQFRKDFSQGRALITPGIAALGEDVVGRIIKTIAVFDDFCNANDPYQEHDFGCFDAEGETIMFKIDYYNKSMDGGSENPADPDVTERVITVMLSSEY